MHTNNADPRPLKLYSARDFAELERAADEKRQAILQDRMTPAKRAEMFLNKPRFGPWSGGYSTHSVEEPNA